MGQRANLIVVENNQYTLYYDHWAANSLDSYLFWGPEQAVNYCQRRIDFAEKRRLNIAGIQREECLVENS